MEIFTAITFATLSIAFSLDIGDVLYPLVIYFYTSMLSIYAINNIAVSRGYYYPSIIIPIGVLWLFLGGDTTIAPPIISITTLSSLLMVMVAKGGGGNQSFVIQAASIVRNILFAACVCGIVSLLLFMLLSSIDAVFKLQLMKLLVDFIIILMMFIVAPLAFMYFERSDEEHELGRLSEVIINYILSSAVVIYGVVLYVYFAKIIFSWSLPNGGIAMTSIAFIVMGLITKACREVIHKPILEFVFKYFHILSIPAIFMMWLSAVVRVSEYGMTGPRGLLTTMLLVATVWCVSMAWKKLYDFRRLTIFSIVIMMAYVASPIFGYEYFEARKVDREPEPIKRNYMALHSSRNKSSVDISNTQRLYFRDINSQIRSGDVVIKCEGKSVVTIKSTEFVDYIFKKAEVTQEKNNITKTDISLLNKQLLFENDEYIISASSMGVVDNKYLDYIYVEWIIEK